MNLLHLVPYYTPAWAFGGVVQAAAGLAEAQAAAGHRVTVLTTDALDRSRRIEVQEETLNGVDVVRVRNWSPWLRGRWNLSTPPGFGAAARRLLPERSTDLIHLHELRTAENLLVAPAARRLGVPLLVSPHGTLPYTTGRATAKRVWDSTVGRRWMGSVDQVVALTVTEAEEARRLWARLHIPLREDQIAIVPNGVELLQSGSPDSRAALRERWGLGDRPTAIFLGRLAERKGLRLLVAGFAEVARRLPEARLVIAGPDEGELPRLRLQVRAFGIDDRVSFPGMMTGSDRLAALRAADVFVLPATGEGFPIAALEALACGVPAVLTEGCNFPEVAPAGAGLVVPSTAGALAEALERLLRDASLRASMGRRGRDLIASIYTWPRVAGLMEQVYRTVLDRRKRAGR
jgi:glycosyltransferase involved in cell wall biosynthesis